MKKYLGNDEVVIIKDLRITDKKGKWVQVEMVSGNEKGMRRPVPEKDITEK